MRIYGVASPIAVVVLVSTLSAGGFAREWTRFRGPNGSGISDDTSIPTSWTESDFNWRVEIPGRGHSHPVVWGEKLFLTSTIEYGKKRLVFCLDASTGATVWSKHFDMDTHGKHRLNNSASSTPTVDADLLYVAFASPDSYFLRAFDHAGEIQWTRDIGPFASRHGHSNSPVIVEDMVVLQNDQLRESFIIALDKRTGTTRWKTPRRSSHTAYSTPCVYREPEGVARVILTSTSHGIASLDARTGKVIWEESLFKMRTCSSPVVAGKLVVGTCGSGSGGNYLVAARIGDEDDEGVAGTASRVVYKLTRAAPYVPTPVIKGDRLYLWTTDGVASCCKTSTGEMIWRQRVGGKYFSSPILVGGRLYNASADGEVVVLSGDDEFEELARNPIGGATHTTPAVAAGRMYLRTFSHLLAVGGKTSEVP